MVMNGMYENYARKLTRFQLLVWELMEDIISRQQTKTFRHKAYALPRQSWIAKRLGCSRATVSRALRAIKKMGLLKYFQMRKFQGRWSPCLYTFTWFAVKMLHNCREALRAKLNRVAPKLHIAIANTLISYKQDQQGVLQTQLNINKVVAQEYFNSLMKKYGPEEVS